VQKSHDIYIFCGLGVQFLQPQKLGLYLLVGEAIRTMLRFCGGECGSFASETIFNHLTFFSKVQEDLNRWFFSGLQFTAKSYGCLGQTLNR